MSAETFTYKGISAGKYVEGTIEAINQDEASSWFMASIVPSTYFPADIPL